MSLCSVYLVTLSYACSRVSGDSSTPTLMPTSLSLSFSLLFARFVHSSSSTSHFGYVMSIVFWQCFMCFAWLTQGEIWPYLECVHDTVLIVISYIIFSVSPTLSTLHKHENWYNINMYVRVTCHDYHNNLHRVSWCMCTACFHAYTRVARDWQLTVTTVPLCVPFQKWYDKHYSTSDTQWVTEAAMIDWIRYTPV